MKYQAKSDVTAWPVSLKEFIEVKDKLKNDESEDDKYFDDLVENSAEPFAKDGIVVKYPNDKHKWLDKETFFSLFAKADGYEDRLVIEYNELTDRIGKLKTFMLSDKFGQLSYFQQQFMLVQCSHMQGYRRQLANRINMTTSKYVDAPESIYLRFGEALDMAALGYSISREAWNPWEYIVTTSNDTLAIKALIKKMPLRREEERVIRGDMSLDSTIDMQPAYFKVDVRGRKLYPYSPSWEDIQAEDWTVRRR